MARLVRTRWLFNLHELMVSLLESVAAMEARRESLADYQMGKLSLQEFEWEERLWPSSTTGGGAAGENGGVPEVDLRPLYESGGGGGGGGAAGYAEMVGSLAAAAASHGFFQVLNHGVSVAALESLYGYARQFFALPLDDKYEACRLTLHPTVGPSGYMCGNSSSSPNKWWNEGLRFPSPRPPRLILRSLADQDHHHFCDIVEECSLGLASLAQNLVMLLLEGLGLERDLLKKLVTNENIPALKLSHYPLCEEPNKILGLPPHSDVSIITLLWQDQVGGLQVKVNGDWVTIKPRQDAIVVNIGDMFQVWSNDQYLSGVHRVTLNSKESRYSIGYFYYSGMESMLTPIPELLQKKKESSKFRSTLLSEHRSHAYKEVNAGEYKGVQYLKISSD